MKRVTVYDLEVPCTLSTRLRHSAEPIKGSRFIATAAPVSNEDEAKQLLADVTSEMPDASHHCWAWRIAEPAIERAGDDGEPNGSAGRPILAQIAGRELVNVAVIVTRYFGGTKLGVGGLVRAYGGAAAEVLETAAPVEWKATIELELVHEHNDAANVQHALQKASCVQLSVEYGEQVVRRLRLPVDAMELFDSSLADATAGRVRVIYD